MLSNALVDPLQSSVCGFNRFGGTKRYLSAALISRYITGTFDVSLASLPDLQGVDTRDVYLRNSILGDGVGYLSSALIVGSETVVSKNGTATVTIAAGRINVGVGTLWSFVLSNGSSYEFASKSGRVGFWCIDISGNERHLELINFTSAAYVSGIAAGSDYLNQAGVQLLPQLEVCPLWKANRWTPSGNDIIANEPDGSVSFTYVDNAGGGALWLVCANTGALNAGVNLIVGREYILTGKVKMNPGKYASMSLYSGTTFYYLTSENIYSDTWRDLEIKFTCNGTGQNTRFGPRQLKSGDIMYLKDLSVKEKYSYSIPIPSLPVRDDHFKFGWFSDSHYSDPPVTCADISNTIASLTSAWAAAGVDAVLGSGDTYDNNGAASDLTKTTTHANTFQGWLDNANAPSYLVEGNHDVGLTTEAEFLGVATYTHSNWYVDIGAWRIILFANFRYWNSGLFQSWYDDINYLQEQLVIARAMGKKVIIVAHTRLQQDYPGSPASFAEEPTIQAGLITPSALTGTVTLTSDTASTFTTKHIGEYIFCKEGTNWAGAIIKTYVSDTVVTADVILPFVSLTAISWGWKSLSAYSLLSKEIRAVINAQVALGTDVKFVLTGHEHSGFVPIDPDGYGVIYIGVLGCLTSLNGAIVELHNGTYTLTGIGSQPSYNGTYWTSSYAQSALDIGRVKYPLYATGEIVDGSTFTISQSPELFTALGEGPFFDASGVPKTLTYTQLMAAHDGVRVFTGANGVLIYGSDTIASVAASACNYVGHV